MYPFLTQGESGIVLSLHVSPGRKKSEIVGIHDDCLKVTLAAPPVDGKANKELCSYLARFFGVPKRDIEIVRGESSRKKSVHVVNVSVVEIEGCLQRVLS
ncbi:MAG: YggU family protein [Bdellovibrionales bacterium]|nr:YggU family protein [Bdellovibrionales bacterium]